MDANLKQAIKDSIDKWERLCTGKLDMRWARSSCPLCAYCETVPNPDGRKCFGCPLFAVEDCEEAGSTWSKINAKVRCLSSGGFLYLKAHPELRPLFERMLAMVRGLLPDGE